MVAELRWWLWCIRSQVRHFLRTGHFYRRARIRPELLCHEHYEQRYGKQSSSEEISND